MSVSAADLSSMARRNSWHGRQFREFTRLFEFGVLVSTTMPNSINYANCQCGP
jgi:hypothetical protein